MHALSIKLAFAPQINHFWDGGDVRSISITDVIETLAFSFPFGAGIEELPTDSSCRQLVLRLDRFTCAHRAAKPWRSCASKSKGIHWPSSGETATPFTRSGKAFRLMYVLVASLRVCTLGKIKFYYIYIHI